MKKISLFGKRILSALLSAGMVISMMPANISLAADAGVTVYAAAFQDAADISQTSLPAQVEVGGTLKAVEWNLTGTEFAVPYQTVSVTGTTEDAQSVLAKVEVLPEEENQLVYFVDASRDAGKESKAFDAVAAFTGGTLKNTVADQVYDETSGWGRMGDNFREKGTGGLDVTDKSQTGWYSSSNTALNYQYRLEPGVYIVTAGFREWWGSSGNSRTMKLAISGEKTTGAVSGDAAVSRNTLYTTQSVKFTVKEADLVKMEIQHVSGQAPAVSWFAVEKESERKLAKENLQTLIDTMSAADDTDYLEESWNAFTEAMENAKTVLADPEASKEQAEEAAAALNSAYENLQKLEGEESGVMVYAAAYRNAGAVSETSLPENVQIGQNEKSVAWNFKSGKFAVPYRTVEVSGITADSEIVRAKVEVLPEKENPLVYFVDSSRDAGKESKAYDAVAAFAGGTLKNTVADQAYEETSGWGRTGDNFSEKSTGNIDVTEKGQTGWYSSANSESLNYQYKLEAGVYTLTAGFREWWATSPRNMRIKVSGAQTEEVLSDEIAFSRQGEYGERTVTFTVKADSLVKMEIQNTTGKEAPVISWFAIEKEAAQTAKAQLQKVIEALPKVDAQKYTEDSYQAFASALAAAQDVLADAEADKKTVEDALAALQQAYAGLKEPEGQKADKTALQAAVDQYKDTDVSGYTSESAKAFTEALLAAQQVLENEAATQIQVDEAVLALNRTYGSLTIPEIQESGLIVYAAAYKNAAEVSDTSLPATVSIDGRDVKVTWTIKSKKFAVPYQTVNVTGTTENYYRVQAQVEVLPDRENELVYFVDASRGSENESQAFNGIKALRGEGLKNAVADQAYAAESGWGRTNGSFHARGTNGVDVTDKYQTGWYGENGDVNSLNYQYMLEAGTYTVTAGFREWWNGPRTMKLTVSGDAVDSVNTGEFAVSGSSNTAVKSLTFTVREDGPVNMSIENKSGSDAAVISWFAVAKGTVETSNVASETEIVVRGSDVEKAAQNVNGLTYKGYGLLSGNSTSNLLMDYKTENPADYEELLQVLFGGEHPLITHVKMEMGNDGNNSTGADSCTMRFENEEADVSRSPGFQLAADAKKINPDLKISFLRWEMPAWVQKAWDSDREGAGYEAMYKWYRETVFDAYEKYGYIVDYIDPDKNETTDPDEKFIKWFRSRVTNENEFPAYMDEAAKDAYHNIKIIASDENTSLNIVPSMRSDKELYDAIDAIGFHYSTGTSSSTADYRRMADEDDKEVWYSEGCATFSYTEYQENKNAAYGGGTIGGYQSPLALADNFIASFIYSRKTHYIFQPAVGSFYEGAQYDHKEIISAREPWAGYVHYDPMIYMLQHFTKFSKAGWENADNTAGIWRVIAGASGNTSGNRGDLGHIVNENGNPSYMTLAAPDKSAFSVVIVNNSDKTLPYSISAENMNVEAGAAMEIWETKTDSYMQYKGEADYEDGCYTVEVEPFSMITVTTLDSNGNEEYGERLPEEKEKTVLDTDLTGKTQNTEDTILYADDFEYSGYAEDYLEKRGNEPRYAVDFSGAFEVQDGRLKQLLTQSVGQWNKYEPSTVIGDFRWMNYKASVDVTVTGSSYAGLNIRQQTGMGFEGSGYNLRITREGAWTLKKRGTVVDSGKVEADADGTYQLAVEGRGGYITAWVDGVQVAVYNDPEPEYFGRVRLGCGWAETVFDNLKVETLENYEPYATKMIDNASDDVAYMGSWNIIAGAGGSNNDWYRSTSTTSEAGASFRFTMNGGGFALLGENGGTAVLDIEADGQKIAEDVSTQSSQKHCAAYVQYGLEDGSHEITVTVKSGTFVLDAIDFLPHNDSDRILSTEPVYAAAYADETPVLPDTVTCTTADGRTVEKEVVWDTEELVLFPYETVTVNGTIIQGGIPASAQVEIVPRGLQYFISGGTGTGYMDEKVKAAVSKPYNAIAKLVADLKNDTSDAAYTKSRGWGYKNDGSMSSTIDGGNRPEDYVSTDKYLVGLRDKTKGSKPMTYSFTLDAGNYVLTAGYHEFWGSRERDMQPSVTWTDENGEQHITYGVPLQLRGENIKSDINFALTAPATVEYQLAYVSGEAPMFSWLAVQKAEDTEEEIQSAREWLQTVIEELPEVDASLYTEESYNAFAKALEKAQEVLNNPDAIKAQLDWAREKLDGAYLNLQEIPAPDKTELEAVLEEYENVNASEYTEESYLVFEEALKKAQEVQADAKATKEQIEEAVADLRKAYADLKQAEKPEPADKNELQNVLNEIEKVDAVGYTEESYKAFAEALDAANHILADENATKEQVEEAIANLRNAYADLKKAEVQVPVEEKIQLAAPEVKVLKSTAAKSGSVVKITVSQVANADSYAIYRNVGGKVTLVGETISGVIEDKNPVSGKKASYYAVAKSKNVRFTESAAGTAKVLMLAKDTRRVKVKKSGKNIKVTFRKVKGAKGYLVYRSVQKDGTWKKLTKKPIKKLSYLDKKAKKGKTYYYKVVVYGKNKTYSAGKNSKKIRNK